MEPASWIELSKKSLYANLRFLRRVIGPEVKFCSVVKGDAYGHCIAIYVPLAEECGVRHFAVFSAEEAARVLDASTQRSSLMIMGQIDLHDLSWAIENEVSFFAFDPHRIDAALRTAKKLGRRARIHLEVETGLHRTGLSERGLHAALKRLLQNPEHLELAGLCTHLSGAESSANYYRIGRQKEIYRKRLEMVQDQGITGFDRHVACSAAIFNHPDTILDLVRVGIAQYGFWPSEETRISWQRGLNERGRPKKSKLERVMSWRSRVMGLNTAPSGAFVGYGLSHQVLRKARIAAVPVGYTHGFPRAQSNLGHVLIRGHRCPVVGTVSMNSLSVDVTDLPGVALGDEVVLIGRQGEAEVSVGSFGERTHELSYEVLARLSAHLPRIVVD